MGTVTDYDYILSAAELNSYVLERSTRRIAKVDAMKPPTTRRAFVRTAISALASFGVVGCSNRGRAVNKTGIESASKELAKAISKSMDALRKNNPGTKVYAVVLVALDDFSDVQLYANTEEHLAKKKATDLSRWYFGEFWSSGLSLDFSALTNHLGEVEDWDEDEEPENSNAVDWLAAMTHAMRHARDQAAFNFNGQAATIYCSMVDSLNAIWLEDLSARFLNTAGAYAAAAPGIKAASSEWYQSGGDEGSSAFRAAYESALS
jgi:hypothetical protein